MKPHLISLYLDKLFHMYSDTISVILAQALSLPFNQISTQKNCTMPAEYSDDKDVICKWRKHNIQVAF